MILTFLILRTYLKLAGLLGLELSKSETTKGFLKVPSFYHFDPPRMGQKATNATPFGQLKGAATFDTLMFILYYVHL